MSRLYLDPYAEHWIDSVGSIGAYDPLSRLLTPLEACVRVEGEAGALRARLGTTVLGRFDGQAWSP